MNFGKLFKTDEGELLLTGDVHPFFAQLSLSVTVLLKTSLSGVVSGSTLK